MSKIRNRRASGVAALASIAVLFALIGPVAAAEPAFEFTLPAGSACGFDLHIAGFGDGSEVVRDFTGHDGTELTLVAGTGYALTFTNETTEATLSLNSSGAVNWTQTYPDVSQEITLMGHNVVILSPGDVGGPSTTLYVGKVTIGVAADGTWTVGKVAGSSIDICAAIS